MNAILNEFYKTYYLPSIKNKSALKNQELYNLYQKPKKDKGIEQVRTNRAAIDPHSSYQADVLYMPEDPKTKDKYVLTVVDMTARGKMDAYPFKELNATSVIKGFKTIFSRGILPLPKYMITLDKGAEFKNAQVEKYFNDKGVFINYSQTGRSRQIAFAEYYNKVIAKALFMRMTGQELLTDEPSLHWVEDLPKLIEAINKHTEKTKIVKFADTPLLTKKTIILAIGTPVRVQLDKPKEVYQNQKLSGRFRETDVRWTVDVFKVADIILDGGQPPLYRLEDIDGNLLRPAFTFNQLQVVKPDEQDPPAEKVIRGTPTQYVVKKVVDKRKYKNKWQYLLQYKGYNKPEDQTWEYKSVIEKSKHIKRLIDKYEAEHADEE